MPKTTLNPNTLPVPPGSYSQVAVAPSGRLLFIAGQTASDPEGKMVGEGDIRAQTRHVIERLGKALTAAGGTLDDIVAMTVFITDARFYRDVNEVRREIIGANFPTSTMVQVVSLARPGLLVEMNAIAVLAGP